MLGDLISDIKIFGDYSSSHPRVMLWWSDEQNDIWWNVVYTAMNS